MTIPQWHDSDYKPFLHHVFVRSLRTRPLETLEGMVNGFQKSTNLHTPVSHSDPDWCHLHDGRVPCSKNTFEPTYKNEAPHLL